MQQEKIVINNLPPTIEQPVTYTDQETKTTYEINNRTAIGTIPIVDMVVKNDSMSKCVSFKVPKFFDGINLFTKIIEVGFLNANFQTDKTTIDKLKYVTEDTETITIFWWLPASLAVESGRIQFQLRFYELATGTSKYTYMWQTKISEFAVEASLELGAIAPAPLYTNERQYEVSNRKEVNWSTILDFDLPININNKTIEQVPADLVVSGDTNSQALSFTMPRFIDKIDISKKVITIKYVNASGLSDRSRAINLIVDNETIQFTWLINGRFTVESGIGIFAIEILGYNFPTDKPNPVTPIPADLEFFYVWQTKPVKTKIEAGLYAEGSIPLPSPEWEAKWQVESQEKLNQITALANQSATSASNAQLSATAAYNSQIRALTSENKSKGSEARAKDSENQARASKEEAESAQLKADESALLSQKWAIGTSPTSDLPSDTNNAKYYANQASAIVGNKGWMVDEPALLVLYPNNISNPQERNGWFVILGSTDSIWVWDAGDNKWKDSGTGTEDYNALTNKPAINGNLLVGNKSASELDITPQQIGAAATLHNHLINQIVDFPTAMPADGGVSDTFRAKYYADGEGPAAIEDITETGFYIMNKASRIGEPNFRSSFGTYVLVVAANPIEGFVRYLAYDDSYQFFTGTGYRWSRVYSEQDKPTAMEIEVFPDGFASCQLGQLPTNSSFKGEITGTIDSELYPIPTEYRSSMFQFFGSDNRYFQIIADINNDFYFRVGAEANSSTPWRKALAADSVINHLTSTSVTSPLSAAQGKVIEDRISKITYDETRLATAIDGRLIRTGSPATYSRTYYGTSYAAPADWEEGDIFMVHEA